MDFLIADHCEHTDFLQGAQFSILETTTFTGRVLHAPLIRQYSNFFTGSFSWDQICLYCRLFKYIRGRISTQYKAAVLALFWTSQSPTQLNLPQIRPNWSEFRPQFQLLLILFPGTKFTHNSNSSEGHQYQISNSSEGS